MKKILTAIALIMCLALPLSAMAMSTITDNELSSVTGQAGVSINLDVNMDFHADTLAWGDADGSIWSANIGGTATNAGWVGLSGLTATGIKVRLRTDLINTALANLAGASNFPTSGTILIGQYNAAHTTTLTFPADIATALSDNTLAGWATAYSNYNSFAAYSAASAAIKPLTIDVATDSDGSIHGTGVTFVRIGLGSIEISVASLDADVKLGHTNVLEGNTLGSIYMAGMDVKINRSSYIDIYKGTGTQGVVLDLALTIDSFGITTLAWGDADGLVGTTTQGWVGLKGLTIAGLTVTGPIAIDVATDTSNKTYVNIGFGTGLAVGIGNLDATVALGAAKTNLDQELGSLYLSALNMTITGAVQVSAHTATSGVAIDLNLSIAMSPFTVSWGDSDGMGVGTTAGFVGLKTLTITGLTLAGEVTIDVATVDTTIAPSSTKTLMYAAYNTHQMGNSFVHIGIGTGDPVNTTGGFAIGMTSMATDVVLAGNKALTGANTGTLGSIYMAGMTAVVNGWVDIAAH